MGPKKLGLFFMNTLRKDIIFRGVGIHSGEHVEMTLSPSNQEGIYFKFKNQLVEVKKESIGINHIRSTTLTNGHVSIHTPEHFLAACYALKLTNIIVSMNHSELPIMDGSAIELIQSMMDELVPIQNKRSIFKVKEEVYFNVNDSHYYGFPSNELIISVILSYPNHWLKSMVYTYHHSKSEFITKIAPARTFGFTHEIDALRARGLAKGGSLDNALIISDSGYLNEPRFEDELARHKILDFIGDMSIMGQQLKGNFMIIRPSHHGNCEFLKSLCV